MSGEIDFSGWSRRKLEKLRDEVDKALGSSGLNLEQELVEHYERCKGAAEIAYTGLQEGTMSQGAAAVLSATTGALKEIARLQTDLYNADKVKTLESAMIAALRLCDDQEAVLDEFERVIREAEQ